MIKKGDRRTFIHYGSRSFEREKFDEISNKGCVYSKPYGGLWACSTNARYGWREFCLDNGMYAENSPRINDSFCFSLKEGTKILHLEEAEDFDFLPVLWSRYKEEKRHNPYMRDDIDKYHYINWEAMKNIGIDAVEYIRTPYGHDIFYTWDFDSLVVLNPNVIVPIQG